MTWNPSWEKPVLLAGLILCGASLGVDRIHAAPSANLDQTRNGKFNDPENPVGIDVNGNAGFQNSHYLEGHSIPYRCVMSDLPANTQITIRLGFDIRHSSRNAIDYLTGFQLLDPHTQFGHPPEEVNPTVGTSLFEEPPTPDSELTIATPNATIPANSFNKLPTQTLRDASKRKMSLWGGTLNSITYVDNTASWNAKLGQSISQIQIDATFTTGSGSVAILSWAGHIASRADWGFDASGIPNSAGGISGSPYHMALISWSLDNIGQQDRSLKADAVIIPPTCDVTGDSKCVGQTATLTVTPHTQIGGFGDPYTFRWSRTLNADGSLGAIISTAQTLSFSNVQLSDGGTYYAQVVDKAGIHSLGCSAVLNVYPTPIAVAGPGQRKCEDDGKSFVMAATASNGSILWTVDSQSPSDLVATFSSITAEDPTVTLSKPGTATLKLTVTSQSNPSCGNASDLVVVTVFPEPIAVAGPGQAKCAGEPNGKSFLMAATASNGSILWTVDSQSPSDLVVTFSSITAEDPTVTLSKAGTATLRLTVASQSNPSCGSATDKLVVTVNDISVAPLGNPVACNVANGAGTAVFTASPTATSATKDFGWQIGIATSPGSQTFDFYSEVSVVPGLTFSESPITGTLTFSINTLTYKGGMAPGVYQIRAVATDPTTGCVSAAATGTLTVAGPVIACGSDCAGGAAPLLVHRLDGDAQGGAAIVNDAAVALETFPSGTDISYETFDKFAALGLAPGQVTTTQLEIPICNKGNVPLENVRLTLYKGNTALEQSPTDCVTVPDGTPFGGTLAAGQSVTLLCTIEVQCGTVPITVSGTTSAANGACTVESSCSVEVECIEVFCRTTGGGRQDPSATTLLQVKSGNSLVIDTTVKFTTHGGQMRGRQTIPLSAANIDLTSGSADICGQWQHVRHASNGRLQSFHTAGIFDSLRCACLECDSLAPKPGGEICNPEDRVCGPEPRRANANAIAVTGVGKMALTPGKKETDVVFRIYIEDRGEPGGSPFGHPADPPDVYCIQIWVVNSATSGALRASISGWLGTGVPTGAPVPDISDCGDLSRGNHQLHPVKNLHCP